MPRDAADIPGWIIRQATAVEDSRALNEAGVPVLRIGVGLATLNTAHRGITFD